MADMIKVTVSGSSGSGKSAIAELIRQSLAQYGIEVELNDDNGYGTVDELPGVIAESLNLRIQSLNTRGTTVEVQTKNVFRYSKLDQDGGVRLGVLNTVVDGHRVQ